MKSSIKIDFLDRGTGKGLEPVIRIELIKSEDPRDTLIQVLFESIRGQSFLQLCYSNHKHVTTSDHLPDMEKTILLFKPEINTEEIASIIRMHFCKWALKKGWSIQSAVVNGQSSYVNKKGVVTFEDELFKQFLEEQVFDLTSEEATHSS